MAAADTPREPRRAGITIYRVRDGKIIELVGHDDLVGALRQLGVVELES